MDNHPIPQDVTGFQFKLIGSMTIKQFGYVGAGVILSAAFFYAPIAWYLKFLLVPMFAVTGISLAFLPVAGRPLDLMASYFLKALMRPNQFVYQKTGGSLSFMELSLSPIIPTQISQQIAKPKFNEASHKKEEQLLSYLYNTAGPANDLDKRENQLLTSLFSQTYTQSPAASSILQSQSLTTPQAPTSPVSNLTQPNATPQGIPSPQTTPSPENISSNPSIAPQAPTGTQSDNLINQPFQAPLPPQGAHAEFPNLINGIVKDSRGNVLPGILIEVLNQDNESVRAFKTNALGQFASATQLVNGNYTIIFEDPKKQHTFSNIQLNASGSPLAPLNIVSMDAREELRQSLFG